MTARDTCRYPSCDRAPGQQDREDYRAGRFCSVQCEVRFEHIQADARAGEGAMTDMDSIQTFLFVVAWLVATVAFMAAMIGEMGELVSTRVIALSAVTMIGLRGV